MTNEKMVVTTSQVPVGREKTPENAGMDEMRLETALGHKQELSRHFSLWSLTSLGIIIAK